MFTQGALTLICQENLMSFASPLSHYICVNAPLTDKKQHKQQDFKALTFMARDFYSRRRTRSEQARETD
jgi:hypothetical protein